jgi:hypothetical protein
MEVQEIVDVIAIQTNRQFQEDYRRVVANLVKSLALTVLKQRIDKKGYGTFPQYMQSFDIPLTKDDTIGICDIQGCYISKSNSPIPISMRSDSFAPFYHVGSIEGSSSYTYINREQLQYMVAQPLGGLFKYYTLINNYLYILNTSLLKYVNIRSIFEDAVDVTKFANCHNCPKLPTVENFLIPRDLETVVIEMVKANLRGEQPDRVIDESEQERQKSVRA